MNEGLDVKNLKEHDAVFLKNPTDENFAWKFNGQEYNVKAGEIKSFSKFVTFHLAKHLSTKMITESVERKLTKKQLENRNDPVHTQLSQLNIYDTHERRIALFKILGNEFLVEQVISQYPFKGFIGDMSVYKDFVQKQTVKEDSDTKNAVSS